MELKITKVLSILFQLGNTTLFFRLKPNWKNKLEPWSNWFSRHTWTIENIHENLVSLMVSFLHSSMCLWPGKYVFDMQLILLFFFLWSFYQQRTKLVKEKIQICRPVAALRHIIYLLKLVKYQNQISLVKCKKRKIYIWLLLAVLQCHHLRTLTNTKAPHAESHLIYFNII